MAGLKLDSLAEAGIIIRTLCPGAQRAPGPCGLALKEGLGPGSGHFTKRFTLFYPPMEAPERA